MTHRPHAVIAASATALCLLLLSVLGWAAVGPWGLVLPFLVATAGLQQPNGHARHPNRTSAALWQTLPLVAVALVPFAAVVASGGPLHHAVPPAVASVFVLAIAVQQLREHLFQMGFWIATLTVCTFLLWILAVGMTSSAAPATFHDWNGLVEKVGPWVFACGVVSIAGIAQILGVVGRWHIHHKASARATYTEAFQGAWTGACVGLLLGLVDPFPSPSPLWLWILCAACTGAATRLLDIQHNRWLALMAWSLPKPGVAELEMHRVETAIALADALHAMDITPTRWELVWDWREGQYNPAVGVGLRLHVARYGEDYSGAHDTVYEVLKNAHKMLDVRYGESVRPGGDGGSSPIRHLSAHGKMAARAALAQTKTPSRCLQTKKVFF